MILNKIRNIKKLKQQLNFNRQFMKVKSSKNSQHQNKQNLTNQTIQFDKDRIVTRSFAQMTGLNKQNCNYPFAAKNILKLQKKSNKKNAVAKVQLTVSSNLLINPSSKPLPEIRPHDVYQQQIIARILYLQNGPGFRINPIQIKNNKGITQKIHIYLIKFIYKTCIKFFLKRTTFALAVFYFDKYISLNENIDDQTILAAVQAALWIAMKYQQIYPPALEDWVSMKLKSRVLQVQAEMLAAFDFKLAHFTLQHFYQYQIDKQNRKEADRNRLTQEDKNLILKLIDLCVFDYKMYQYKPSQLVQSIFDIVKKEGLKKTSANIDGQITNAIKYSIERNNQLFIWLDSHALKRSSVPRYQH